MNREGARMAVQKVLEDATLTMRHVAQLVGVSYVTVRQWKTGRRVPDAPSRRRLAAALRKHAARLERLARQLEETAGE